MWNGEEETGTRKSKDKLINKQETELLEKVQKLGLGILNGNKKADEQGEWTFTGVLGSSVIDCGICNAEAWEKNRKVSNWGKNRIRSFAVGITIEINI